VQAAQAEQHRQQGEHCRPRSAAAVIDDNDLVDMRCIAIEVLEREEGEFRGVRRPEAREECPVDGIVQFDQQIVVACRISRRQLGDDVELVVACGAVQGEHIGRCVLVPRAALVAEKGDGIDVDRIVVGVRIEQQVDAVVVAIAVVIAEQHHVGRIKPEIVTPGLCDSPALTGFLRDAAGSRPAFTDGAERRVYVLANGRRHTVAAASGNLPRCGQPRLVRGGVARRRHGNAGHGQRQQQGNDGSGWQFSAVIERSEHGGLLAQCYSTCRH